MTRWKHRLKGIQSSDWGLLSFYIFLPPSLFPCLFLPLLPPSFFPPSTSPHHSKMLPGPVLVAMVTKTGGWWETVMWLYPLGFWLVWRMKAWREGMEGERGLVVMSHTHRFPDGRDPQSGRLASTHRHNGRLFKVGLMILLGWVTSRTSGLLIWHVRLLLLLS